jgi:uncharacterized protein
MIYERIRADIVTSMKNKESAVTDVLRLLDSEIQTKALTINKPITDDLVLDVITKGIKQRNESIEAYTKYNRQDLLQKEILERDIYKKYQPEQLSQEDLTKLIDEQIIATGAKTIKDMGLVMKILNPMIKGKADSKIVSEIIKSKLGNV